jgi:membrane associated rhomboid family serine protease
MAAYQNRFWVAEPPHTTTFVLIAANVFVFWLCLRSSTAAAISPEVLLLNGAMYSHGIERHEYWRLVAYGFLHANLLHLAVNMLCLALWGGYLEKRVGSFYFLVIYFCAMVVGAITSDSSHSQPYLAVGASGAISGILGALLCLWILGKIGLSANFFVTNIGLNVAVALISPKVDWAAHFGGFAGGLMACASIDILERLNKFTLRCKFPEFVKINFFILSGAFGVLVWNSKPSPLAFNTTEDWFPLLAYFALCLAAIKLVDLLLSLKKGLAIVVIALSAANAGLVLLEDRMPTSLLTLDCASRPAGLGAPIGALINLACLNWQMTLRIVAACAFAVTILLYSQELVRGVKDVGFVGATLRADRKRGHGI